MKHLREFGSEDFKKPKINIEDYAPAMTKDCEGMCDRKVVKTSDGPVIVCDGCKRVVMDNRK